MKLLFFTVVAISTASLSISAPSYTIELIDGMEDLYNPSLNSRGDLVAGKYLWRNGNLIELGNLGRDSTVAEDINDHGIIVGRSGKENGTTAAFIWENGTMSELPSFGEGQNSFATAINNYGETVGYSTDGVKVVDSSITCPDEPDPIFPLPNPFPCTSYYTTNRRGNFWLERIEATDLGTIDSDKASLGRAINDLGHMVGESRPTSSAGYQNGVFFHVNGTNQIIFRHSIGGDYAYVNDLNNMDEAVGKIDMGENNSVAYLWRKEELIHFDGLENPNTPNAINDFGDIVGVRNNSVAYIYTNGIFYDLLDCVDNPGDWSSLKQAYDINNQGQIVGIGRIGSSNTSYMFLLTPTSKDKKIELISSSDRIVIAYSAVLQKTDDLASEWSDVDEDSPNPEIADPAKNKEFFRIKSD